MVRRQTLRCAARRCGSWTDALEQSVTAPRIGTNTHLVTSTLVRREVRHAKDALEAKGDSVSRAYIVRGYTGEETVTDAAVRSIELHVLTLSKAMREFVLLTGRWGVERTFAWTVRFRRLAKYDERLPQTVAGLHYLVFTCLMLRRVAAAIG